MAPTNARVPNKNGYEQLTDLDLQPLHDPEVRFTVGHRHFAAPNPVHVGRQFINVSFKKVIDSWFWCPSFRKAFPFMRNASGDGNDGRSDGRMVGGGGGGGGSAGTGRGAVVGRGWTGGARARSHERRRQARVWRRRRDRGGRVGDGVGGRRRAARGVSRRAETYVGQVFPNGSRFRPIRPKCPSTDHRGHHGRRTARRTRAARCPPAARPYRSIAVGFATDVRRLAEIDQLKFAVVRRYWRERTDGSAGPYWFLTPAARPPACPPALFVRYSPSAMPMPDALSALADNPYFGAGFGLFGLGLSAAALRKAAAIGLVLFRRNFMMTLEVPCRDKSYQWVLLWVTQKAARRTQHLSVETTFEQMDTGRVNTTYHFLPSIGVHLIE